jgi:hypothetical protein
MIQGLFFDGVDAEAARATVSLEDHRAILAAANKTESLLSLAPSARARADVALHPAVREAVPELGGVSLHVRDPG